MCIFVGAKGGEGEVPQVCVCLCRISKTIFAVFPLDTEAIIKVSPFEESMSNEGAKKPSEGVDIEADAALAHKLQQVNNRSKKRRSRRNVMMVTNE